MDAMQDAEPAESENKVGWNAVIFVDTILPRKLRPTEQITIFQQPNRRLITKRMKSRMQIRPFRPGRRWHRSGTKPGHLISGQTKRPWYL